MRNFMEFIERSPLGEVTVKERYEIYQHRESDQLWHVHNNAAGTPFLHFYTTGGEKVIKPLGGLVWRLCVDPAAPRTPLISALSRQDRCQEAA